VSAGLHRVDLELATDVAPVTEVDVAGPAERSQPQPDARYLERGTS
jgi:hypothetical protein